MSYFLEKTSNNFTLAVISEEGKRVYLHSKINPISDKTLEQIHASKSNTLIVLGLALGYHITNILPSISAKKIIIIEHEKGLKEEIEKNKINNLFCDKRILCVENCSISTFQKLLPQLLEDKTSTILIADHHPSVRAFPMYYGEIKKTINDYLSKTISDISTIDRFGKIFFKNAIKNISYLCKTKTINCFINKFTKYDAVIVSSGPSLDKSLSSLQKNQNKIFIIAADSAVQTLISSNILPDFIVSIDPQPYTWEHLQNAPKASIYLKSLSANFSKNDNDFFYLNTHPLCQLIKSIDNTIESMDANTGNVTGDALVIAKKFAFNKIYILGLDSSFPENSIYSKGSAYQKRFSFTIDRFNSLDTKNFNYIYKNSSNLIVDNKKTRKSFLHYKAQIEKTISSFNNVFQIVKGSLPLKNAQILNDINEVEHNLPLNKKEILQEILNKANNYSFTSSQILALTKKEEIYKELFDISLSKNSFFERTKNRLSKFMEKLL